MGSRSATGKAARRAPVTATHSPGHPRRARRTARADHSDDRHPGADLHDLRHSDAGKFERPHHRRVGPDQVKQPTEAWTHDPVGTSCPFPQVTTAIRHDRVPANCRTRANPATCPNCSKPPPKSTAPPRTPSSDRRPVPGPWAPAPAPYVMSIWRLWRNAGGAARSWPGGGPQADQQRDSTLWGYQAQGRCVMSWVAPRGW